mmetsp:Transcript_24395/g.65968  ORF Transcript_24395/g.65968 Transcript_24395/m.65968 type:complete len:210 (+) Transcript_24395:101-730(+)
MHSAHAHAPEQFSCMAPPHVMSPSAPRATTHQPRGERPRRPPPCDAPSWKRGRRRSIRTPTRTCRQRSGGFSPAPSPPRPAAPPGSASGRFAWRSRTPPRRSRDTPRLNGRNGGGWSGGGRVVEGHRGLWRNEAVPRPPFTSLFKSITPNLLLLTLTLVRVLFDGWHNDILFRARRGMGDGDHPRGDELHHTNAKMLIPHRVQPHRGPP